MRADFLLLMGGGGGLATGEVVSKFWLLRDKFWQLRSKFCF